MRQQTGKSRRDRRPGRVLVIAAVMLMAIQTAHVRAGARLPVETENAVTAGELIVEPPTLENLGFEWRIDGDANRNASVAVAYRAAGDREWRIGLPLLRLQGEDVTGWNFKPAVTYIAPNMFADSVFDLRPGTEYEVRLTLSDVDGVRGAATKTVTVRTRPEPMPSAGGTTYHVYPHEWTGPKQEPSFKGLLPAYYQGSVGGDWYNAFPPRVKPGDIILVHAGLYQDKWKKYAHEGAGAPRECCNTTGDGTYYLTAKGTADQPIVIKAAGDGEVIFDGNGNYNLFNVMAADHHYFEGITFRNTMIVFEAGIKRIAGSEGLTVKHSKFYDIGIGVHTDWAGSKNFYIADNEFVGRHDPDLVQGFEADLLSQFAVKVYGSGHVIAHNRIRNFHDGIDHATYGDPEGWPDTPRDRLPVSIDIYNNEISNMHDNCIEADGAMQNIRVMRNFCANSNSHAYSMQTLLGGPAYFIRNVAYHAGTAMKFSETPAGGVIYHNTFLTMFSPWSGGANPNAPAGRAAQHPAGSAGSNMHLRNNLILRQPTQAVVFHMPTSTNYSSSDYNGFFPGQDGQPFGWSSPRFEMQRGTPADIERRHFTSLAEYSRLANQDQHSVLIGYDVFEQAAPVDMTAPRRVLDYSTLDLRLRRGAVAIDRGVALPNINDGFSGTAPDIGAFEAGQPLPVYGPRPVRSPLMP